MAFPRPAWLLALMASSAIACQSLLGYDDVKIDPDGGGAEQDDASTGGAPDEDAAAAGSGGSANGGSATGGNESGGSATGGASTGGSATGGASTGGSATGGSTGDPYEQYRQACIDKINELRATKSLAPYARWKSAESCVDDQATHDEDVNKAHDAFSTGNPSCGGYGQNECPGWGSASAITGCLESMWAEKDQAGCAGCDACDTFTIFQGQCPDCEFNGATVCGHYVNMSSKSFSQAACGFSESGSWAAINFQ